MNATQRLMTLGPVGLGLTGALACWWAVRFPLAVEFGPDPVSQVAETAGPPARPPAAPAASVPSAALFRPSRTPAPIPFDPLGNQPTVIVVESQPSFVLVGLVLGPARAAVIRGIPGLEAAQVFAEGDERAGLRVVRIDSAGVSAVWHGENLRLALPREGM